MLNIKSLSGISISDITKIFNSSFSDYYFPIRFTEEQMMEKFASENGVYEFSVGAFYDDNLVGFIMHYYNEIDGVRVIYNGGTGVIPSFRGQGIGLKMYAYILPILKAQKINTLIHEVLSVNAPAIKI